MCRAKSEHNMPVVAHCASPFLPVTTVWMYDQIRALRRYRPVVLTQAARNLDRFPFEPVLSAEFLPEWRQGMYRAVRRVRGTYAGYGRWLKEIGAALIHAHFGQEGFRCLAGKRGAGVPMATAFYGLDVSVLPQEVVWRRRFARLFAEGEAFLAEGAHMAQRLMELGCPPDKVVIQHLGVDLGHFPFCPARDAPVVLTYAAFREKKGLVYALRAFARVREAHPEARLRMIGDGPLRGVLTAEIAALGIGEQVEMLGMLAHEAAIEELKRASVLLYPSVTASDGDTEGGAPVALIEAMAVGTPVVSSRHADIPEVAPCGLLFEERDVDGLAEGLDALLGSESLRMEKATAGRAHVAAQHDLVRQAQKLEGIYDRMMG